MFRLYDLIILTNKVNQLYYLSFMFFFSLFILFKLFKYWLKITKKPELKLNLYPNLETGAMKKTKTCLMTN